MNPRLDETDGSAVSADYPVSAEPILTTQGFSLGYTVDSVWLKG